MVVNVSKASAAVWLWSWIRTALCAALKELIWDTVVRCLEERRREGQEAAAEAYVFVVVEMRSVVKLMMSAVFWISWIESWVLVVVVWTPWSRILTFSMLSWS